MLGLDMLTKALGLTPERIAEIIQFYQAFASSVVERQKTIEAQLSRMESNQVAMMEKLGIPPSAEVIALIEHKGKVS